MLAGVSSAYLIKGGVTQSIASIKCCTLTRQMGKIIFSTVEPSELDSGLIKTVNITKMQKEVEDANGNTTLEDEFFTSAVDYNSYMKPIEVTDEDGIVTEYTYNDYGEVLTEKVYPSSQPTLNTLVTREYSGGNLSAVKEKRLTTEYTHAFNYNSDDTLNYEVTPGGQYIYRSYTADREKLSQIRATVSGGVNSNDMTYTNDLLNTATHNGTTVAFGYDERNNVSNVNIAGVNIISKTTTYNSYGTTQVVTEYANGAKIKAYYDKYNRLIRVTDVTSTETEICAYIYSDEEVADSVVDPMDGSLKISASSKLYAFIDTTAGKRTNYVYDEYGNLKETQTGDIKNTLIRDDLNRPERSIFYGPTSALQREVVYENDKTNRIASEKLSLGANFTHINYTRDALKRITEIKTVKDGNGYERKFAYLVRGNANSPEGTTNYVGSVSYYNVVNNVSTLEKSENIAYNADGNIVTYGDNTYVYDNLGRLLRENNKNLDKTTVFVYNVGGNIVSKTEYAYTTGTVGTAIKTYNYTYGNTWKDQLTAFDGTAITYDAAGNPTSYLGKTLTWSRGRLLTKYVSGSKTVDMQYDAKGIRIGKTRKVVSTTTNCTYIYDNSGKLRTEIDGNTTRNYIYGQDGVVGYEENGVHFMYRKNFFGDIVAIYQGATKIVEYSYDAWGNCTIVSDYNGYGARNPFRYRGYYFDNDLGMYYLTTRYYDPQTGRFINADTIEYLKSDTVNGLNLYAYCGNNPVMNVDPTGHEPLSTTAACLWLMGIFTVLFGAALVYAILTEDRSAEKQPANGSSGSGNFDFKIPSLPTITIPTVEMAHITHSLFEAGSLGSFFGNISYTVTTQKGDSGFIYNFIDCGNDQTNSGTGINFGGLFGFSTFFSNNSSAGFNVQSTPWCTAGLEIGLNDGISFSGGLILGNDTHEISFSIGWGTIIGAGACVIAAYAGMSASVAATAAAALTLCFVNIN